MKEQFYIGWQPKAPDKKKFIRKAVLVIVFLFIGSICFWVLNQSEVHNGVNELGKFTAVTGVLTENPVPMLNVKTPNGEYDSFLMFGFGKQDAQSTINVIKKQIKGPLNEYDVTVNCELIYYDGKTIVEAPDFKNTEVQYKKRTEPFQMLESKNIDQMILKGQIIDPKCFFGVMKPGQGKVHRSCAIRCISGGIPPVFMTKDSDGLAQYMLLLGEKGEVINQKVLDYVAVPISITGSVKKRGNWLVMEANVNNGIKKL